MKNWSVNKWHRYLLCGVFLTAQLVAIAHLPVHALESFQAAHGLLSDQQSVELEQCSICLAANYLDSGIVSTAPKCLSFSPLPSIASLASDGLKTASSSLYLARAPPVFS